MTAPTGTDRRSFLANLTKGGLAFAITSTALYKLDAQTLGLLGDESLRAPWQAGVYLRIADDGTVTVISHRSEMGQGIRTSLAMIVADELNADWSTVVIEQADGDRKYGDQNTDGSRSIRQFYLPLRQAGAAARMLFERAAAEQWGVPVADVVSAHGVVRHNNSTRELSYAVLLPRASALPMPAAERIVLKPVTEHKLIGKEIPSKDLRAFTTGSAIYGHDVRRPGMRFAVIARPPVYGSKVEKVESTAALAVKGVLKVVQLPTPNFPSGFAPLGGVAVIATNSWAAIEGRKKLAITWSASPHDSYDSKAFRSTLEAATRAPGKVLRQQGDVAATLSGAAKTLTAEYYIPHIAHAPMETPAAVAEFVNGKCEIWAPSQSPQGAQAAVAGVLGIPATDVTIHVTFLGGGFGRKSKPDFASEAAWLAKETGTPIQVLWTREDDIQHGYYHTVNAQRFEGALDPNGKVIAWHHRSAFPAIGTTFGPAAGPSDGEMAQGALDLPFDIPNLQVEACDAKAHTRIGWYRSVINVPHAFAIGSFVDELAHAAGKDPRDFWYELLGAGRELDHTQMGVVGTLGNYGERAGTHRVSTARYRKVIEVVTAAAGWGGALPKGTARGLSAHRCFSAYTACVIQLRVGANGAISFPRVDIAIDAGTIVNAERVKSQMEGAVIMGLGNVMQHEITFAKGRAVQSNLTDYRIPRIQEMPRQVHVHLVPSDNPPGGVGEPGVAPVPAAFANALFAATGKRIRSLPLGNQLRG